MWNELYNAAVKVQNDRMISPFMCGTELELLHKKAKRVIVTGSVNLVIKHLRQFTCWMS